MIATNCCPSLDFSISKEMTDVEAKGSTPVLCGFTRACTLCDGLVCFVLDSDIVHIVRYILKH